MSDLYSVLVVIHIINTILMAWPVYALVTVDQRARLGPPLGDRTDIYMENIIKSRTIPCFIFQGMAMVTGLALIFSQGRGLDVLVTNPVLGAKFVLLIGIGGVLSFVHFVVQPRIDSLFAQAGEIVTGDVAAQIGALRIRRKRAATVCMFGVLTSAMLGAEVWVKFPLWLTAVFVVAIVAFCWRVYKSGAPYGWF